MPWNYWGTLLAIAVVFTGLGALLQARHVQLLRSAAPRWQRVERYLKLRLRRFRAKSPAPTRQSRPAGDDTVVLIPDGRPWPLSAALQLLELAWRWQVVHGSNLPLRARQGEGAYVWRPPLPARSALEQASAEAERQR